jgi:DNA repair protein RadC
MGVPIRGIPVEQRPRERLLRLGPSALSDAELLSVLLGGGRVGASSTDVALELLQDHHGLSGLAMARVEDLVRHAGLGPAKAARLVAGVALASRLAAPLTAPLIGSSEDLAGLVVPLLAHEGRERLVVVVLDGGNRARRVETVSSGGVDRTALPVREVLALVLRHDGRAFALAHNHPGGTLEPSPADIRATAALRLAAGQVDLRLVDHLVVAGSDWTSIT